MQTANKSLTGARFCNAVLNFLSEARDEKFCHLYINLGNYLFVLVNAYNYYFHTKKNINTNFMQYLNNYSNTIVK